MKIRFEPLAPGSGFVFENDVVGGTVPKEYIPGVEKGLKLAKESGVIAGFPMIDFKATLIDGQYHDVDLERHDLRHRLAGVLPRRHSEGRPEVARADDEGRGRDPEGLHGRRDRAICRAGRGQVQGMDSRGNAEVINAMVPLANMFGYVNTLRSMSQGRAQYTMHFDHYEQVPQAVADEVRAKMA